MTTKQEVDSLLLSSISGSAQEDEKVEKQKKKASIKWHPKKWRPEYERIVALSVGGVSNEKIAEISGFTPAHVCNILGTPEAEFIKQQYIERLREKTTVSLPELHQKIAEKAAGRLLNLLENDEAFEKSPFHIIDRGLRVSEGMGHLGNKKQAEGQNTNFNGPTIILPAESADLLIRGLAKADKARQLNPPSISPALKTETAPGKEVAVIDASNGDDPS